jgi:hypothetical protein
VKQPEKYSGIAGLEGKEPYGVVLSIGIKNDQGGFPREKDRFHLLEPLPQRVKVKGRTELIRRHHPRFHAFNSADKAMRRMVTCQIVHKQRDACFEHKLLNYRVKGRPHHPNNLPFCTGDGVTASRYVGLVDGHPSFDRITCPHDRCEFRQAPTLPDGREGPKACKPWMKLLFRLVWANSKMPTAECLFTSGSWNNAKHALGFFDNLHAKAVMVLGNGRPYSLGGYRFTLTLGEKTNAQRQSIYPVVTFAPIHDPIEFFTAQLDRMQRLEQLFGAETSPLLEHEPARDAQEYLSHNPGAIDV